MPYVIDQKNCSGCHACRVSCPVSAITFRNDKYWIDPEKCISCGTCAEVCHNECISDPAKPAPKVESHEKIMLECDVAVVGAGAAGLACAARAAENGARVIVLEKGKEVGGSADYAHQIKVHYSKWHKELGPAIIPPKDIRTRDKIVRANRVWRGLTRSLQQIRLQRLWRYRKQEIHKMQVHLNSKRVK